MARRTTRIITAVAVTGIVVAAAAVATGTGSAGPDCDGLLRVAHRGSGGLAPENTAAAMRLAEPNGAGAFEVDVQLSADGRVVVMHDGDLSRTTDVAEVFPGREADPINSFTLAELETLDAGSWWGPDFAGERIPTLDVVAEVATTDDITVTVELKDPDRNPGLVEAVHAELTADSRWAELMDAGRVIFFSFDAVALEKIQEYYPQVPVAWVNSGTGDDAVLAEAAQWADFYGVDYRRLADGDLERIEEHGMRSMLYTVDGPDAVVEQVADGVDLIVGDFPNVLWAACGGPDAFPAANGVTISTVVADPKGDDLKPETGEHLVLTNTADTAVDLGGYRIVDALGHTVTIPPGRRISAGAALTIYIGPGIGTADRCYLDADEPLLDNKGDSLALRTAAGELLDVYGY